MDDIHRDHPAVLRLIRVNCGHGDLKEPLGADKIGVERRPERIAGIADARDMEPAFAQACIVEGHNNRPTVTLTEFLPDRIKEGMQVDFAAAVEAVVCTPVPLCLTCCGKQGHDGVSAQTGQLSHQMGADTPGGPRGKGFSGRSNQLFEPCEECLRVFFTVTGEAGVLGR